MAERAGARPRDRGARALHRGAGVRRGRERALAQGWPDVFVVREVDRGEPTVLIRLGGVDLDHLVELVTESWRTQAPKYLVEEFMNVIDPPHPPHRDWPFRPSAHSWAMAQVGVPSVQSAAFAELLIDSGLITDDQLAIARAAKAKTGSHIDDVLMSLGLVSPDVLRVLIARTWGIPPLDVAFPHRDDELIRRWSGQLMLAENWMPVRRAFDGTIVVATARVPDAQRRRRSRRTSASRCTSRPRPRGTSATSCSMSSAPRSPTRRPTSSTARARSCRHASCSRAARRSA